MELEPCIPQSDRKRLLFATTGIPFARRNGGEIASMNFIDGLAALGHEVVTVGYKRADTALPKGYLVECAGSLPIEISDAGHHKYLWFMRSLAAREPFTQSKFRHPGYLSALKRAMATPCDMLIIDHAHMGWVDRVPGLPAQRILIAHNAETLLYRSVADASHGLKCWIYRREGRLLEREEARLVQNTNATWCLTEADRDSLLALANGAADPSRFHVFDLPGQPFRGTYVTARPHYDIGMIGSWQWEVNRRGLLWLIKEVLPNFHGDFTVAVAGTGSDTLEVSDARLELLGRVPDAEVFMRSCRILAVPTVTGSGVQLKTIEGLSLGVPMVATSLAMRGIKDRPDYLYVADDADTFAAAMRQALDQAHPSPAQGQTWADGRLAAFRRTLAMALHGAYAKGW